MSSIIEPDFRHCIESLSCSPLLYINIQRFLSKKKMFMANEKKQISQEQVAYQHICEKFFLHQDEIVRNHIKDICGEEIFEEKNVFSTKLPYTMEHHSLFSDLPSPGKVIAPVTFQKFQEVMKQKIYPFRYGNLGKSNTTKLSIRTVFLSILANCFVNAVVIALDRKGELPFEPMLTWFQSRVNQSSDPTTLHDEWAFTTSILNDLQTHCSKGDDKYILYFIKFYMWNRITLVADAFLQNRHRFKRKLLYPNYLWLFFIKKNGLPRKNQKDIIDSIENELFVPWSYSIYQNLAASSNEYIDSAIKTISTYCSSAIPLLLDEYIITPLTKEWSECDFPKLKGKDTQKKRLYTERIKKIADQLHRKDKYAYAYFPFSFRLDNLLKTNINPFLYNSFHECAGQKFTDVSKATTKQVMSDNVYRISCPLQILQLPKKTLQDILSLVKNMDRDFHTYLKSNIKSKMWPNPAKVPLPFQKESVEKVKMNKLCRDFYELIKEDKPYRLYSDDIAPIHDKFYYAWIYYAALYLNNKYLNESYKAYCTILTTVDDVDPLLGLSDLDLLFTSIKKSISKTSNIKKQATTIPSYIIKVRKEIFSLINKDDRLFQSLDSKDTMISYCFKMINEKHFYVRLFFWWICGFMSYLKKGIILRNESKQHFDDNGCHINIKRIGLSRLEVFQMRTCELTNILCNLKRRIPPPKKNRNDDKDKLKALYDLISPKYNLFINPKFVKFQNPIFNRKPFICHGIKSGEYCMCSKLLDDIDEEMLKQIHEEL